MKTEQICVNYFEIILIVCVHQKRSEYSHCYLIQINFAFCASLVRIKKKITHALLNFLFQTDVSISSSSLTGLHGNTSCKFSCSIEHFSTCAKDTIAHIHYNHVPNLHHSRRPARICIYSDLCIDFVCNLIAQIHKFAFAEHTLIMTKFTQQN